MSLYRCLGCGNVTSDTHTMRVTGCCQLCSTWRDKFAAHALAGLLAKSANPWAECIDMLTTSAFALADAMLLARRRNPEVAVTMAPPKGGTL